MALVGVLLLANGEARAWVGDPDEPGRFLADERRLVAPRSGAAAPREAACREALSAAVEAAGRPGVDYLALTVSAEPHVLVPLTEAMTGTRTPGRAGAQVGELVDGWPLPATLPVVIGPAPAELAALGAGAALDGVTAVVVDGDRAVLVSGASRQSSLAAGDLTGLLAELRTSVAPSAIVVCGDGLADRPGLPADLARALGREVHSAGDAPVAAAAGVVLGARAVGAHAHLPGLPQRVASP
jgi:hypothetical protein